MIHKRNLRNKLGLIILTLIVSFFSLKNVYADDDYCKSATLKAKYQSIVVSINEDSVVFSADNLDSQYSNVQFELINYVAKNQGDNNTVNEQTIDGQKMTFKKGQRLTIKPTVSAAIYVFNFKVLNDDHCGDNGTMEFTVRGLGFKPKTETVTYDSGNISGFSENKLDCSNPRDEFEKKICNARKSDEDDPTSNSLYCSYNDYYLEEELKGESYYKNVNTLYHSDTTTHNVGTYTYHYAVGDEESSSTTVSCTRKCEEAVEVMYGPPVASKAGLCFEYKVKVISRVHCETETPPAPASGTATICTPAPYCYNGNWSGNQGGPNEDFDKCIKKCDGGKYSLSCSKKCYKKVYGKSKKLNNGLSLNYAKKLENSDKVNTTITTLSDCKTASSDGGCYYWSGDTILWSGAKTNSPGRWYTNGNPWGLPGYTYSVSTSGIDQGIYRASDCTDVCYWTGCSKGQYLNKASFEADKENNKKVYEKAKEQCNALATCKESTATFTITASYTDRDNKVVKKEFPLDHKDGDFIKSKTSGLELNSRGNNDTTFMDDDFDPTVESASNGCYEKTDGNLDRYRATWHFPGSWISLKDGEVFFTDKSTSNGFRDEKDKFCIPLDAKPVNTKWWNSFQQHIIGEKYTPSAESRIATECEGAFNVSSSGTTTTTTTTTPSKSFDITSRDEIDYNIQAKTTNFGYFGWNIDINCFFALAGDSSNTTNGSTPDSKAYCEDSSDQNCLCDTKTPKPTEYRIRSVELENLFPDEGEGTRDAGFNWTAVADTSEKNPKFASTPVQLIEKIQNNAGSIYSDDNLDYEFVLTRSKLRSMRREVEREGLNYTNFDVNDFVLSNGVSRYTSNKIRNSGIIVNKIPDISALSCNNLKNSSQCEEFN